MAHQEIVIPFDASTKNFHRYKLERGHGPADDSFASVYLDREAFPEAPKSVRVVFEEVE